MLRNSFTFGLYFLLSLLHSALMTMILGDY